jgi:hypothetical protein
MADPFDNMSYSFIFNQPYEPFNFDINDEMTKLDLIDMVVECMDEEYPEAEELLKPIIESVNKND